MKKILFILGSADISGGTYVILQHALYLHQNGFDITLACCIEYDVYLTFKRNKQFWHPAFTELNVIRIESTIDITYEVAIFTWWRTVYYLPQIQAEKCIYFVQSIESKFYDANDIPLTTLVNDTYTFNLPIITEATWIQDYLNQHYQVMPLLAKNGIRKDLYTQDGHRIESTAPPRLRVLIEGPLNVPFKNTEKAIELCTQITGIEVWLLTSSKIKAYPGVDRLFSHVPIHKVGEIYRSCDVLVKLSYVEGMFAPPLEMFHCGGTCIVYNVTGHDEYIKHGYNGLVVNKDDEKAVISALRLLSQDDIYLHDLKQGAIATARQWINWDESSQRFKQCLTHISQQQDEALPSSHYKERVEEALARYETNAKRTFKATNDLQKSFFGFLKSLRKYRLWTNIF